MITETAGSVAPATTQEFGAAIVWLRAKIGEPKVAMLTSADRRYMPSSRPMITQQIDDDGVLWFFAASDGDLAESIEANPRVNVSYSDTTRGAFASLSGYAGSSSIRSARSRYGIRRSQYGFPIAWSSSCLRWPKRY